ncbi:tRNA uridine-5-carboxymethylaminomethyl(34) synthesis GTPase MnmE [Martelella lutilitoris]|uniref:tRNA modification GTPase MnmE n=1 Tax=Martelella lutilitoris TaxID=2583532 RepID=A0A5C4JZ18_9HYPH|nr:tRNA uridine-5-carboxymethylaminomethyl(34) synthesis GTPase MnmE [Martelella lutilitoris]TNB49829.1 tRNA uridine-5-carboxymethylaminomethyl(34) synthesis GTPase MnmE [Martelella lutilitoris]
MRSTDTIFALSSGALPSGVAVIRLSGATAFDICAGIAGRVPPTRQAQLMTLRDAEGVAIDQALVLAFAGPASFTGEDCVEFHLHGGRAVVRAMLDRLAGFPETRHAEAGEFSRRAFENGKLDLVEAEGLSDIIVAETEMQRRLAMEQTSGRLSGLYERWAGALTHARAMIEAELDFSDEEDVPGSVSTSIWQSVDGVAGEIRAHLAGLHTGEIIRDGYQVVIAGAPNAGKSSLLNALAKRDIAIVTDIAGTTRDILEVHLDIGGYAVRLYDTAGLRETEDKVEAEGVRRARALVETADLVLSLADMTGGDAPEAFPDRDCLLVGSKSDLSSGGDGFDLVLSSESGEGIDRLIAAISDRLSARVAGSSLSLPVRARQADYLRQALAALDEAMAARALSPELPSESLRRAAVALGRITGRVDVEDLLDVIFSSFCVGK